MGRFDVIIVGAGPAGAAAALVALRLRPAGRVALVERARFPRDKTCGDGIGPTGVAVLERLDARTVLHGAARIDRLRISTAAGVVAEGSCHVPVTCSHAPPSTPAWSLWLWRGAVLLHERITRVEAGHSTVVLNGHLRAPVVVGADGANSVVRRQVGAGTHPRRYQAVSLRGYAPAAAAQRRLEFRFPAEPWPAYGWSFPNAGAEANVGVVVLDGRAPVTRRRLEELLEALLPELPPRPGTLRGARLPLTPGRPPPAHGSVLLAGDVAGLVNPLSGEGIAAALLSGALAGRCAVSRPEDAGRVYTAALSRCLGRHTRHADLAARAFGSRRLVDSSVAAAARSPGVFADLAGLTVGTGALTVPTGARVVVGYARRRLSARV